MHKKIDAVLLRPYFDEANMTFIFEKSNNELLIMSREDCIFSVDTRSLKTKLIY